jgi:hypothetical protein
VGMNAKEERIGCGREETQNVRGIRRSPGQGSRGKGQGSVRAFFRAGPLFVDLSLVLFLLQQYEMTQEARERNPWCVSGRTPPERALTPLLL